MLVLSRKLGEAVHIDSQIKVTIVRISDNRVKVGIEAPSQMQIVRSELDQWDDFSFDQPHQQEIGATATHAF